MTEKNIEVKSDDHLTRTETTTEGWSYSPNIDIVESVDETTVLCDMPGALAEDIAISVDDRIMRIHSKVRRRHPGDIHYMVHEYGIGDFDREISLIGQIDVDQVKAEYELGVLTIHLPKSELAKPRRIPVRSA